MERITNLIGLKQQIAILEQKREIEKDAITEEVGSFLESLKPVNLLKSVFSSVKKSPDLKSDIMHGIMGIGTGFLTNKLLLGSMHGPLKKILSVVLQAGITNAAVRYPETIKDKGISLLTKFLKSIKIKSDSIDQQHVSGSTQL